MYGDEGVDEEMHIFRGPLWLDLTSGDEK